MGLTLQTNRTHARMRAYLGELLLLDTRGALVATADGRSPFFLIPRTDVAARLVDRSLRNEDGAAEYVVRPPDQDALQDVALIYPDYPDHVRIDPRDLRQQRARWIEVEEPLRWLEEDRATFPYARSPSHSVDTLALSEPASIIIDGAVVAKTTCATLVLESGLPGRVYVPGDDFVPDVLQARDDGRTVCPYKGVASYFDVRVGDRILERTAWGYDNADAAQNVLLPTLDGQRCVVPGNGIEVLIADDRLPAG